MKVVKQMRDVGNDTEASIVNYGSAQVRCDPGEVAAIAGPLGAEHIYGPPDPRPAASLAELKRGNDRAFPR